jgi:GDP-4-dehydro-6-deoxy-D-mannose reductase
MTRRRVVITGVDGFVGRHLARIAALDGYAVTGISRSAEIDVTLGEHLSNYVSADLRDGWPTATPVDGVIVHLAGLAAVGASFDRPQDYLAGNSAMVTNMCEALASAGSKARIVAVSSGAVYAPNLDDPARVENDPVAFTSPYVVSKVLVENQLAYYRRRGLDTVVVRPFNHIGPGQGPGFLVPDLIQRLRSLAPGASLSVGNLATRRDYTDVRDVARAYLTLGFAPELAHDVYNVASGRAYSGAEILELICAAEGRDVPECEVDTSRFRATDPHEIVGDATRLREELGWAPEITITTSLRDAVGSAPYLSHLWLRPYGSQP